MSARMRGPVDLQAERAVLGGVLSDESVFAEVASIVEAEHFSDPAHATIFRALLKLRARKTGIDTLTVTAELRRMGKLACARGGAYLCELASSVPTTANTGAYAAMVREMAERRRRQAVALEDAARAADIRQPLPESARTSEDPAVALKLVRASEVEPEDVEWLWPGYLPKGKVVVLDGDPGTGKTTLALGLVAAISRGRALPAGDVCRAPADAVVSSAEDGLGDTIVRRLLAADADRCRVHLVDLRDPKALPLILPRDVGELEARVVEHKAALLVIDPLMAHLDPKLDSHRDQDARLALAPVAAMAQRTGCTVLVIRHLNKAAGGPAIYRGGGSIGITGAARVVLLAARDPDAPGECVLAPIKSNLGPPAKALRYSVGSRLAAAVVLWGGESDHSAETLLAHRDPNEAPALREAEDYLRAALAAGPRRQSEVEQEAKQQGISVRTLRRAKKNLGVVSEKRGWASTWHWSLPPADGHKAMIEDGQQAGPPSSGVEADASNPTPGPVAVFDSRGSSLAPNYAEEEENPEALEDGQAEGPSSKVAEGWPASRTTEDGQGGQGDMGGPSQWK